jgi:NAD(P)-dependent dehydrogenase (short-subunit alcohol dehydrogenase family)
MGAATVRELLDLGAEITGLDVRDTDLPVKEFIKVDLADRASIDAALDRIPGPVDALFVCSGLPGATRWSGSEVFTVNFLGARHVMERTMDKLGDGGAIAGIASVAGMGFTVHQAEIMGLLTGAPSFEDGGAWCEQHLDLVADGYGFSKECLILYTMWRSTELAKRGLRINCISPGPTDTPMMPLFEEGYGKDFMRSFPKPIGRMSTPEEQAYPLIFLNSAAATYITGTNLFTDGGFVGGLMTGAVDVSAITTAPSGT